MEARYGLARRIWVMDRGMTSEHTLTWLRDTGRRYLVGTPRSELRKWARQIADARDWEAVRDGIEAKRCGGPDGVETFVLIRSIERREKEQAIRARFARRKGHQKAIGAVARHLAEATDWMLTKQAPYRDPQVLHPRPEKPGLVHGGVSASRH